MTPATNLVVQGQALAPTALSALAARAGARAVVPIGTGAPAAYRLAGAAHDPRLLAASREAGCDAAFVPASRRLADVGLVAMDMDSTLITIECIDEIADLKGIKPEVAAITASAMRGEIDFAQSLTRRVALLAGLPIADLDRIYDERLCISPGAERMLAGFKAAGAATALVSGGFTFFTDRLKTRLRLDVAIANTFDVADGRLTGRIFGDIVDAQVKARTVRELKARYGGLAVVIGDGANDLPMFAEADVSIAYRAKPVVREHATHTLDFCGLDGALNFFN
ncbi:MAG TPA: phosphoserine phosphatase SerB [Casimicrobiaceae bacterium]|nr:phosphoserine phosphatase SerB [Casimicrobiaceae bacterium]